jgi:hypothetical protein
MRLRPWLPFLVLVVQVLLLMLVATWIDRSLPQPESSWGYLFGVVVIAFLYLSLPGLLVLGCALAGSFARTPEATRTATVVGAGVVGVVGVAGAVLGGVELNESDAAAERAFAVAVMLIGGLGAAAGGLLLATGRQS